MAVRLKKYIFMAIIPTFMTFFFGSSRAAGEPWLANRYAQNCAACHAPGRLNKPASGRRCTLSCQGCHVSPQGGGMRNQYGIWNQQRWLRSARTEIFRDKAAPAPIHHQPYYGRLKQLAASATEFYKGKRPKSSIREPQQVRASQTPVVGKATRDQRFQRSRIAPDQNRPPEPVAHSSEVPSGPYQIRFITEPVPPDSIFDQHSYDEWFAVVKSEADFLSAVPEGDPYRLERELGVYASGDLRFFGLTSSVPKSAWGGSNSTFSLMTTDIGVRLKPLRYHKLSAVIEARFANSPSNQNLEDPFVRGRAFAKSAYVLWDDLPYNSYLQYGLYRPMFGHFDPDHNSLASDVSGLGWNSVFKGVSLGTAPNVPFLVANLILPANESSTEESSTSKGYVVTAGGRFVTLGASFSASLWSTEFRKSGLDKKRDMFALTMGGMWRRLIFNLEYLNATVSDSSGQKHGGSVITAYSKLKVWREIYGMLNYATSNVGPDATPTLSEGNGQQITAGAKMFPVSNLEIEAVYIVKSQTNNQVKTDENLIQFQTHFFF